MWTWHTPLPAHIGFFFFFTKLSIVHLSYSLTQTCHILTLIVILNQWMPHSSSLYSITETCELILRQLCRRLWGGIPAVQQSCLETTSWSCSVRGEQGVTAGCVAVNMDFNGLKINAVQHIHQKQCLSFCSSLQFI